MNQETLISGLWNRVLGLQAVTVVHNGFVHIGCCPSSSSSPCTSDPCWVNLFLAGRRNSGISVSWPATYSDPPGVIFQVGSYRIHIAFTARLLAIRYSCRAISGQFKNFSSWRHRVCCLNHHSARFSHHSSTVFRNSPGHARNRPHRRASCPSRGVPVVERPLWRTALGRRPGLNLTNMGGSWRIILPWICELRLLHSFWLGHGDIMGDSYSFYRWSSGFIYPPIAGWFLLGKIPLKWMIWEYPYFRKPPDIHYMYIVSRLFIVFLFAPRNISVLLTS